MPILTECTESKKFIRNEFLGSQFGDTRLDRRMLKIVETLNEGASSSIPKMVNTEAELKAFYRFFRNRKVTEDLIMATHYENTVERMAAYNGKILLLNDSCFVTPQKKMAGLLSRGKGKENCLRTHYCLAVSEDGKQVFGILDFNILSNPIHKDHPDLRDESDIWIKTAEGCLNNIRAYASRSEQLLSRCLFVADREGDEFELMKFLSDNNLRFVIRSQYNRHVAIEGKEERLFNSLEKSKRHGAAYKINIRVKNSKKSALVRRSVLRNINVIPPVKYKKLFPPLSLNMVYITEINTDRPSVQWKLWTTEDVSNSESSEFIVKSYEHRWKIEEMNKATKVGAKIEERQFTKLEHFNPFLRVSFVIGWRILALRTIARLSPDKKIECAFEEDEASFLKSEGKKKGIKMETIKDAHLFIAKLGGFTGGYAHPGWQVLWGGWIRFYERVEGYKTGRDFPHRPFFQEKNVA